MKLHHLFRITGEVGTLWVAYCLMTTSPVWSQPITRDGTLSTNVTSLDGLNFTITDGDRAGANLFHSFSQFSVPTGGSAFFSNDPAVENIISRVTGGASNIDGLIRANGTANLFLINPRGIIFGPNAQLNIGGSLLTSTASSLNFADGTQFSATAPQTTPLLTVSVPIGLQYEGTTAGIDIQGANLVVQPGKTLALLGGDVTLASGSLIAPGGRVELGSVAGPSLISLTPTYTGWALGYAGIQDFQDIQSQQTFVTASGAPSGDIQVQGRRVTLSDGSQTLNATSGSESGGMLTVNASELVEVIGSSANGQNSSLLNTTTGIGAVGDLTIKTGRLIVRDGAQVITTTSSSGVAGNMTVTASESVEVVGTSADSQFPSVLVAGTLDSGPAGNLTIATEKLIVRGGGVINASTFGEGDAGNVTVSAESVELSGTSADGLIPSSLRSDAQVSVSQTFQELFNLPNVATGDAGDLTITTGQLIVRDGAEVAVSNQGLGDGGQLVITANSLQLDDGNILAATASGEGGDITLQAQDLQMRLNSQISTTAGGSGQGGNITIDTNTLTALENSNITANAVQGQGGNIQVQTQGVFRSPDSDITASSELGIGGIVEVNTLETDPSSGLVVLPEKPVSVSGLITQNCSAGGQRQSKFTVTGRGGLPPNPSETLSSDTVLTNLGTRTPAPSAENRSSPATSSSTNPTLVQIVEAQGWVIANGEVSLTAQAPNATPYNPWLTPASCHGS